MRIIPVALLLFLAGCGGFQIQSTSDAVSLAAVTGKNLAIEASVLCQNTVQNGPCAPGAAISTQDYQRINRELSRALEALEAADRAILALDQAEAGGHLAQALAIFDVVRGVIR